MTHRYAPTALLLLFLVSCASGRVRDPREDLDTGRRGEAPSRPRRHELRGITSWYGEYHHGRKTACGEPFNMNAFTAAHKTLPFHTIVRVVDHDTMKSVVVRINDRGPYKKGRVIDLSRAAATDLGILKRGKAAVELQILEWGDGSRCKKR